jgi:outer membrane receptor protein involved in Fe transport
VDNVPKFTSHLTAEYQWGRARLLGRVRHFDGWTYVAANGATNGAGIVTAQPIYQDISAVNFLDLVGSWQFTDRVDLSVGVENLLDRYTETVELVTTRNNGRLYPGGAPYENEGRNLYGRVNLRF